MKNLWIIILGAFSAMFILVGLIIAPEAAYTPNENQGRAVSEQYEISGDDSYLYGLGFTQINGCGSPLCTDRCTAVYRPIYFWQNGYPDTCTYIVTECVRNLLFCRCSHFHPNAETYDFPCDENYPNIPGSPDYIAPPNSGRGGPESVTPRPLP